MSKKPKTLEKPQESLKTVVEMFKPVQDTAPPPAATVINLDEDEDYMSLPLVERINRMLTAKQNMTAQPKEPDEVFDRPIKANESVSANIFGTLNKKTVTRKKPATKLEKVQVVEEKPREQPQKVVSKKQPTVLINSSAPVTNKRAPTRTAATKATAAFAALDDLFDDEGEDASIGERASDQYYKVAEDPSESGGDEDDMYSDE